MPSQTPSVNTQINARIEMCLKQAGDAGLSAAGLTPTQAVRALWTLASMYAGEPEKLRDLLLPDQAAQAADEAERERKRRAEAIARGASIVEDAYRDAGLAWPPPSSDLTYDELREAAIREEYGQMMGWDR